jgi:hypothetical protein
LESDLKRWGSEKQMVFNTQTHQDFLMVKFYIPDSQQQDMAGGKSIKTLVGVEVFDLSALVLIQPEPEADAERVRGGREAKTEPCPYTNTIQINLKRVSKQMSGEIKIKCLYKPRILTTDKGMPQQFSNKYDI